jgi:ABC-type protease/lipase transport system fused ATPase/permease subunit
MPLRVAKEPGARAVAAAPLEAWPALVVALGLSLALNPLILALPLVAMRPHGSDGEGLAITLAIALAVAGLGAVRAGVLARPGPRLERRLTGEPGQGHRPPPDLAPAICTALDAPWLPLLVAAIWLVHPWLGMVAAGGAPLVLALALQVERAPRMAPAPEPAGGAAPDTGGAAGGRAVYMETAARGCHLLAQAAMLGVGALLVSRQQLPPAAVVAVWLVLSRALTLVEQLPGDWRALLASRAALAALRARPVVVPASPVPPAGRLELEGVVVVAPQGGPPLLRGIALALEPGEVLGVLGPSAAGKSTLCRLVTGGLAPGEGTVRLGGLDLYGPAAAAIARHIGYLPQEVALLPGTVRDNIACSPEGDPARVVEAARLAGVHEMILRLPCGYETVIGEGGLQVSAGQRQRLALARALYGEPCLVVLDEPAAQLDDGGEIALQGAIAALKRKGTSVVVVSRRPSVIAQVDRILVLDRGRAADLGRREQVIDRLAAVARAA